MCESPYLKRRVVPGGGLPVPVPDPCVPARPLADSDPAGVGELRTTPMTPDPKLAARAARLVNDHLGEHQNVKKAAVAVGNQS